MNALTFEHQDKQRNLKFRAQARGMLGKAQITGVAIGLGGSVIVAISGSFLIVAGWLVANDGVHHWLSTAGSVLLFLTIPLIILAAFCLDWLEKDKQHRQPNTARYDEEDGE